MTGPLLHHLMSGEYGPFDRSLEIGVFLLIAYEAIVGIFGHRREKKRKELLDKERFRLTGMVAQGEQLRHDTPVEAGYLHDHPSFHEWIRQVDIWSKQTGEALSDVCPKAAVTFNSMRASVSGAVYVYTPNKAGSPFHLTGNVRVAYERLIVQMANLTEIMEKADFYF